VRQENWLGSIGITGSLLAIIAQPVSAQTTSITAVQINQTASGIEIVLETANGEIPQVFTSNLGDTLVFEVADSQLQGEDQEAFSPVEGIAAVTVTSLDTNTVRVAVTGATAIPTGQIGESDRGLILNITPTLETATPETSPDAVIPGVEPDSTEGATSATEDTPLRVVVTATRTEEDPLDVPRSITVITREEIDQQTTGSRDLGEILGQLVPGLAPSTGSASTFGQSLRGRNITVLIDGVPQSTTRNAFRDLRTIDPSAIERIEVLRGPTALYGDGATGGVINIITRVPDDTLTVTTEAGIGFAPTEIGDSLEGNLQQSVSGRSGNFNYAFTGSFAWASGFFDGEGNRIPPDPNAQGGLADADTLNLFGRIGFDLDDDQRLQLTVNHYDSTQFTDFTTDPIVLSLPGRQRSRSLEGLELDNPQTTENTVVNLECSHANLLGSELRAQIYYRDYLTRFFPFDGRAFASLGNEIFQSEIDSEKVGGRLQIETPLFDGGAARLLWGVDYVDEDTEQPVAIFDPDVFDASEGLIFEQTGDRTWVPPLNQRNLGLFAQLNWDISDRLIVLGGVRHEQVGVDVDDFTTLAGDSIEGGNLDYDATLFNLGAVFYLNDDLNVFANFAQGFSVADVGLVLRSAPSGFSVETLDPEAQRVDNFELGIRGEWNSLQASLVGFYNESELGTTFTAPGEVVRAPERIYGIEAAIDAQLSDTWLLGGTISWAEGETDLDDDDNFDPLNGFRIAPIKVTAYVENETSPGWRNRLQALFSGSRDRFEDETLFGQAAVDSYITLDYISSIQLGPGTLEIGINNLLDTDYFPVVSQIQTSELSNAAARGRTVRIGYSLTW
jgi:iron complex outermembrane recepter protein